MSEKINPEELVEQIEGETCEEMEAADYIAAVFSEIMEQGLPVRMIKDAGNLLAPISNRLQRQNEILFDISISLRALATKTVPASLTVMSADLSQK